MGNTRRGRKSRESEKFSAGFGSTNPWSQDSRGRSKRIASSNPAGAKEIPGKGGRKTSHRLEAQRRHSAKVQR